MEAWQVTGALRGSTKPWSSILDVMLVAQGLVLLGTLKDDIEDTQIHSGSARPLLLNKGKPPQMLIICTQRECKPWPPKLGRLASWELSVHTKFNTTHSLCVQSVSHQVELHSLCIPGTSDQGQPHSLLCSECSTPRSTPLTSAYRALYSKVNSAYTSIYLLSHHVLSTYGQGAHSESSTGLGKAVANTAIT